VIVTIQLFGGLNGYTETVVEATEADAPAGLAAYLGWHEPCRCEPTPCPADYCELRLSLHGTCEGVVAEAEVGVAGHLEAAHLRYGTSFVPCQKLLPGEKGEIYAQGGTWIWGVAETCVPEEKPVLSFEFECQ
jgi:hypothetical protein